MVGVPSLAFYHPRAAAGWATPDGWHAGGMSQLGEAILRATAGAVRAGALAVRAVRLFVSCAPARVSGESMAPSFHDGDLLAVRPPLGDEPRVGQVVLAWTGDREVVKRVTARDGDSVFLEGDNRGVSTDPGFVSRSAIRAVVVVRYWPFRWSAS